MNIQFKHVFLLIILPFFFASILFVSPWSMGNDNSVYAQTTQLGGGGSDDDEEEEEEVTVENTYTRNIDGSTYVDYDENSSYSYTRCTQPTSSNSPSVESDPNVSGGTTTRTRDQAVYQNYTIREFTVYSDGSIESEDIGSGSERSHGTTEASVPLSCNASFVRSSDQLSDNSIEFVYRSTHSNALSSGTRSFYRLEANSITVSSDPDTYEHLRTNPIGGNDAFSCTKHYSGVFTTNSCDSSLGSPTTTTNNRNETTVEVSATVSGVGTNTHTDSDRYTHYWVTDTNVSAGPDVYDYNGNEYPDFDCSIHYADGSEYNTPDCINEGFGLQTGGSDSQVFGELDNYERSETRQWYWGGSIPEYDIKRHYLPNSYRNNIPYEDRHDEAKIWLVEERTIEYNNSEGVNQMAHGGHRDRYIDEGEPTTNDFTCEYNYYDGEVKGCNSFSEVSPTYAHMISDNNPSGSDNLENQLWYIDTTEGSIQRDESVRDTSFSDRIIYERFFFVDEFSTTRNQTIPTGLRSYRAYYPQNVEVDFELSDKNTYERHDVRAENPNCTVEFHQAEFAPYQELDCSNDVEENTDSNQFLPSSFRNQSNFRTDIPTSEDILDEKYFGSFGYQDPWHMQYQGNEHGVYDWDTTEHWYINEINTWIEPDHLELSHWEFDGDRRATINDVECTYSYSGPEPVLECADDVNFHNKTGDGDTSRILYADGSNPIMDQEYFEEGPREVEKVDRCWYRDYLWTSVTNQNRDAHVDLTDYKSCGTDWYPEIVDVDFADTHQQNQPKTYDVDEPRAEDPDCTVQWYGPNQPTQECQQIFDEAESDFSGPSNADYYRGWFYYIINHIEDRDFTDHYLVVDADVWIEHDETYEDEPTPETDCTRSYADEDRSCYDDTHDRSEYYSVLTEDNPSFMEMSYRYDYNFDDPVTGETHNQINLDERTIRWLVTDIEIDGSELARTGERHDYTCTVEWGDGSLQDNSTFDHVWESDPYNYIGTEWMNEGYTDSKGVTHYPDDVNQFYSADPTDQERTYTLSCTYYDQDSSEFEQWDFDHSDVSAHTEPTEETHEIEHHGVSRAEMSADGYFHDGPDAYTQRLLTSEGEPFSTSETNESKFMTAHWYDFTTEVEFTDGHTRDITEIDEMYWYYEPWYEGYSFPDTPGEGHGNMPESGLDFRIPQDGDATITMEWFHENVPFGEPDIGRTKLDIDLFAHQIEEIIIFDDSGFESPPLVGTTDRNDPRIVDNTPVYYGDPGSYSSWVVWSDDEIEDWTQVLDWTGDYYTGTPGEYYYEDWTGAETPETDTYATVGVEFTDVFDLRFGFDQWESVYDEIEVKIEPDDFPDNVPDPEDNMGYLCQTNEPTPGQNVNFLPDPETVGVDEWTADNNPYCYETEFPVSGTSSGLGNR